MANAAFQKALGRTGRAKFLMKAANEAEKNADFSLPEIPDGTYILRVKGSTGISPNKNIPYVEFRWVIAEGEFAGKGSNKTYWLDESRDNYEETGARLGKDLKTLTGSDDLDLEDGADLEAIVAEIDDLSPYVKAGIKTKESGDKTYINVYFNELMDYVVDTTATDLAASEPITLSDVDIEKGQDVIFKESQYTVLTSDQRRKTCVLVAEDGKTKTPGVSWADVEVLVS